MDRNELPVEVFDKELPIDDNRKYKDDSYETLESNGGFVDLLFLGAVILVSFMWGMLTVILR